jgi:hypothetical protein
MIRKLARRIWWVPAWAWLLASAILASAIPNDYGRATFTDRPEFASFREEFVRQVIWQSIATGIAFGLAIARWSSGLVQRESGPSHTDSP